MTTRKLVLEKAGHRVTQARDLRQVETECETNSFSVVVLGQRLNRSEKMRISDVVLAHCKTTKILELHKQITSEFPGADAHLQITVSEPQALVDAVNALAELSSKAKAQPAP